MQNPYVKLSQYADKKNAKIWGISFLRRETILDTLMQRLINQVQNRICDSLMKKSTVAG